MIQATSFLRIQYQPKLKKGPSHVIEQISKIVKKLAQNFDEGEILGAGALAFEELTYTSVYSIYALSKWN